MVAAFESEKSFGNLKKGEEGTVSHFSNPQIASKLLAMGILPGSAIQMVRKAPFGGGCYAKVDNLLVALRKNEAETIILK
ncbi:MAG: FeoA family protein [Bacteroidota bacterium]